MDIAATRLNRPIQKPKQLPKRQGEIVYIIIFLISNINVRPYTQVSFIGLFEFKAILARLG